MRDLADLPDMGDADAGEWAEFERLGRAAGDALRAPAPEEALAEIERAARRRTVTRTVAGGTAILLLLLAVGWVAARWIRDRDSAPMDRRTTVLPDGDNLPFGAPGTWRPLSAPSSLPDVPTSATWTGSEVVVLGFSNVGRRSDGTPPASGTAYDVLHDRWRAIAAPPDDVVLDVRPAWTGHEVLAVGLQGRVYSYDPTADRWRTRSGVASMVRTWSSTFTPTAVAPSGVLTRSLEGWWWYDEATDEWSEVPSPAPDLDRQASTPSADASRSIEPLGDSRVVLAVRLAGTTGLSVFDAETSTWSASLMVPAPKAGQGRQRCGVFGDRLVCFGERFSKADGVVTDPDTGASATFSLGAHSSGLATAGTPWFGHAWGLLSARTASWEDLPGLGNLWAFQVAAWDGEELLMFGGMTESGDPPSTLAAAYTPKEMP